jgi:tetratricopeptide (TPR) repeat protein
MPCFCLGEVRIRDFFASFKHQRKEAPNMADQTLPPLRAFNRFQETGNIYLLDSVIEELQDRVASLLPTDHKNIAVWKLNLGQLHNSRFDAFGDPEDLDLSIRYSQEALDLGMNEESLKPVRSAMCHNVATYLSDRFTARGDLEDLTTAVKLGQEAVDTCPVDDPMDKMYISGLAGFLQMKYERLGSKEDLDRSIQLLQNAVQNPDEEDVSGCEEICYDKLRSGFMSRFVNSNNRDDLQEAIEYGQKALDHSDVGTFERIAFLNNQALCLKDRYLVLGEENDILTAITMETEALESSECHPDKAIYTENLSLMLSSRFSKLSQIGDLESAIDYMNESLSITTAEDPQRPFRMCHKADLLSSRFNFLGTSEDLDEAIELQEAAVSIIPDTHVKRFSSLDGLAGLYHERYRSTGRTADLERANTIQEEISQVEQQGPYRKAQILNARGLLLRENFSNFKAAESLDECVNCLEEAASLLTVDDLYHTAILINWSYTLAMRYHFTGNTGDLDSAIDKGYEAAARLSPQDEKYGPLAITLGECLVSRYRRNREMRDIDEAVRWSKTAREKLKLNKDPNANGANILSTALLERSFRGAGVSKRRDFEEAVEVSEAALEILPEDSPSRSSFLNQMATILYARYKSQDNLEDLERAIRLLEQAVSAASPEKKSVWKYPLGEYQFEIFKVNHEEEYLEASLDNLKAYLDDLPENHPNRFHVQRALSACYRKSALQGSNDDYINLWTSMLGASASKNVPPLERIQFARVVAQNSGWVTCWSLADLFMDRALDDLPLIGLRGLTRQDQQYLIRQIAGLAADACAVSLKAQVDPGVPLERLDSKTTATALESLERGRGMIIGLLIDAKSEVSELKEASPDLFQTYNTLRTELNALEKEAANSPEDNGSYIRRRTQAITNLEGCLGEIRAIPRLGSFLMPQEATAMMSTAKDGAIIVINASEIQQNAIIITKSEITSIDLPELDFELLEAKALELNSIVHSTGFKGAGQKNQALERILIWLWNVAVAPAIRQARKQLQLGEDDIFRVWWIGVGPISNLPLHAAGDHAMGCRDNAFDQVISSYAPTIKALSYSQSKSLTLAGQDDSQLLLATMPHTPGEAALPGVITESQKIQAICKEFGWSTIDMPSPSVGAVIEELGRSNIVHFACHGLSRRIDPSQSFLALMDDNNETNKRKKVGKLRVQQISTLNLTRPQLMYLSACSTASNQADDLADEVIHIASGFQVAGFSHVIGSMWLSVDNICAEMAAQFYGALFGKLGADAGHEVVAAALREASIAVRNKQRHDPLVWAPFVHFGA